MTASHPIKSTMHTIQGPFVPQFTKQLSSRAVVLTESLKGGEMAEEEAVRIFKQRHFNAPLRRFKGVEVGVDVIVGHELLTEVPPRGVKCETGDRVSGTAEGERGQLDEVSVAGHGVELKIRRVYCPCMASPVFKPHTQSDTHLVKAVSHVVWNLILCILTLAGPISTGRG